MNNTKIWGIMAEYSTPSAIYNACKKVRDAGYQKWDACTPFPVHGLERAMGLPSSYLPWLVLIAGVTGGILALLGTCWASAIEYPLNIAGKPLLSIPAFIPIIFEVTILFSALTTVFGMLAINQLPHFNHPVFNNIRFKQVTDNKFFIIIESQDSNFDMKETLQLLESTNAVIINTIGD